MLKITSVPGPRATTLRVEGTLSAPWLAALEAQLAQTSRPVLLDLAGVTFMDAAGAALLETSLVPSGEIRLVAASPFVRLMLQPAGAPGSDLAQRKE